MASRRARWLSAGDRPDPAPPSAGGAVRTSSSRLRLALPNKGRLAEPAVSLLHDAGIDVELSERRLSALARNVELELLFVRTGDVAEYVSDGLVDLGLTGRDLVDERGGGLQSILDLGFGACSL